MEVSSQCNTEMSTRLNGDTGSAEAEMVPSLLLPSGDFNMCPLSFVSMAELRAAMWTDVALLHRVTL